ncbi:bifunctional precorrin-2 dehydrogenase/sirohydrochlorin ferrochelatase [Lutibacter sp. TH_r2]|uniref:precorrin-2 dehydrogenase/sirohydrochlorin ferrochelatase family protein n=1 Tax=Lutibacter sp. TH_r2 TaxID=3082083 RepID=UPI00295300D9|nr:bifunctional precorrin-2 dehydrogenase/sirohydrochlorin ferrochelatase [Lutibacter sp. TH_r2]MDV7187825.1 bifunctional precorrin-2 dehydrogenase/sirohydrochlorin ferrochelatase [Lutibacter sp. TH_r2]
MIKNELYPIFLKVHQLNVLIVGGGTVALEKLSFLLKSSPNANVVVVSKEFDDDFLNLAKKYCVSMVKSAYSESALKNKQLVIGATNNKIVNREIYLDAKAENILVNIADTPSLCDFYLGGIVTKGNIKIAISTNGKSPTLAKRLRQFFEEVIPDNIDDLATNLNRFRKTIKGDFQEKVSTLNSLTKRIIDNKEQIPL